MATGKGTGRKRQTICEKSTLIATNLVRASSFLLSKMTSGRTAGPGRGPPVEASPVVQPQDASKSMVVRVERVSPPTDVNSLATEYIERVKGKRPKGKNRSGEPGAVADDSNRTPPPPSNKRATYAR